MGVPGLWDILRPAGQERSLAHLAVIDGFEANSSKLRGLRVGIDASIWFYHATYGKEGENPELRTLFFRCARLMSLPLLPLFVFDGPRRPRVKRNKNVSGKPHWMIQGMQKIIEAFGFQYTTAPGEAEAELAFLNKIGLIDAIISDDVDNFLFGAQMIIRNPNKTLSGNRAHPAKNSNGDDSASHVTIFKSTDILTHEDIQLTTAGLILIGLLRGGDYHTEGLPGCGPAIAYGLAKCGFGDGLMDAVRQNYNTYTQDVDRDALNAFLVVWRDELRHELRTNSQGHLKTKRAALAKALPDSFPDIDVLLSYTNPITSESECRSLSSLKESFRHKFRWETEPDLGKLGSLCELYFEWGVRSVIVRRFRTVIWPGIVLRIMRRAALTMEQDQERTVPETPRKNKTGSERANAFGTPSKMIIAHFSSMALSSRPRYDREEEEESPRGEIELIKTIHGKRKHVSTDNLLEYRLEIDPTQLVTLAESCIQGLRKLPDNKMGWVDDDDEQVDGGVADGDDDDDGDGQKGKKRGKKPAPLPTEPFRLWAPASMVLMVRPDLVEDFEDGANKKLKKKQDALEKKEERAKAKAEKERLKVLGITEKEIVKPKGRKKAVVQVEEDTEDFSDVFGIDPKRKAKPSAVARAGANAKTSKAKTVTKTTKSSIYKSVPKEEEEEGEETEFSIDDDILDGPATLSNLLRKKKKPPKVVYEPSKAAAGNSKVSVSSAVSLSNSDKGDSAQIQKNRSFLLERLLSNDSDDEPTSNTTLKNHPKSNLSSSNSKSFENDSLEQLTEMLPSSQLSISDVLAKLDDMYFPSSQSSTAVSSQVSQGSYSGISNKGKSSSKLFLEEEESFSGHYQNIDTTRITSTPKKPRRRGSEYSGSDKESNPGKENHIKKSPRKSINHSTPKSRNQMNGTSIFSHEKENDLDRPSSPLLGYEKRSITGRGTSHSVAGSSYTHSRTTAKVVGRQGADIIDLCSSDTEEQSIVPRLKPNTRPLILAGAKAKSRTKKVKDSLKGTNGLHDSTNDLVIDLT